MKTAAIYTLDGEFLGEADAVGEAIDIARIRARDREETLVIESRDGPLIVRPDGSVDLKSAQPGAHALYR
jgi:hypothetical protein